MSVTTLIPHSIRPTREELMLVNRMRRLGFQNSGGSMRHRSDRKLAVIDLIQDLARHCGQRIWREWFLNKEHAFVQHPVMDDGVVGKPRHEDNSEIRSHLS